MGQKLSRIRDLAIAYLQSSDIPDNARRPSTLGRIAIPA